MSKHNVALKDDYAEWIESLSARYRRSQIKAAMAVNAEMLKLYFNLGRDIVLMEANQPWGSGFLKRVSVDLKTKMPDAGCFSITNLKYIRSFFKLYSEIRIGHQVGDQFAPLFVKKNGCEAVLYQNGAKKYLLNLEELFPNVARMLFSVPWRHYIAIIGKFRTDLKTAFFYVCETVKNSWSRSVLENFMDTKLHERQGKAISNFTVALPQPDSELAQELTKDPYYFAFIALTPKYHEKELKDAMMTHIEHFLLELGTGFMLVGREYRLEIGTKEKFVDLLFFNMNLNGYVVVEVKTTEFEAEYLGQLGLYITAVNHLLKKPTHEATIGLLVCKTKDNTMVKWSLEAMQQPIGVSEYRISEVLPKDIASNLPTVEEIESAISGRID